MGSALGLGEGHKPRIIHSDMESTTLVINQGLQELNLHHLKMLKSNGKIWHISI